MVANITVIWVVVKPLPTRGWTPVWKGQVCSSSRLGQENLLRKYLLFWTRRNNNKKTLLFLVVGFIFDGVSSSGYYRALLSWSAAGNWVYLFKDCRTLADFLSGSNRVKICRDISLPYTSRFFCRDKPRLVLGTSRSPPCLKRGLFTWLSWQFLIGWGTRELVCGGP